MTKAASESIPLRKSTGLDATMIRSPGRGETPRITPVARAVPAPSGAHRHRLGRRSAPAGSAALNLDHPWQGRGLRRRQPALPAQKRTSSLQQIGTNAAAGSIRRLGLQRLPPPSLQQAPVQVMAPSHVGDPCPWRQALHQDPGFLVCRPPPAPHRAGDHLDPAIGLTLMPALIAALMPATIHWTARPVASATSVGHHQPVREVAHSHRLHRYRARLVLLHEIFFNTRSPQVPARARYITPDHP